MMPFALTVAIAFKRAPRDSFLDYRKRLFADVYRLAGHADWRTVWQRYRRGEAFRYVFWLRTAAYAREHNVLRWLLYYPVARYMLKHYRYKLGISIPCTTQIGPGLFIGHFGGIVVNEGAVIGRNCNLSQGVTIGQSNRGARAGTPRIGDNVYIGPNATIIGNVRIGNCVAIGANAVVTKDVDDSAVVGGIPARVLNHAGVEGYVERTEYEREPWFAHC
jgi:serine O-acetyltransferase